MASELISTMRSISPGAGAAATSISWRRSRLHFPGWARPGCLGARIGHRPGCQDPPVSECTLFQRSPWPEPPRSHCHQGLEPEPDRHSGKRSGDTYGEGGNHFIHTIRRNPGITNIVHNNMVYALTRPGITHNQGRFCHPGTAAGCHRRDLQSHGCSCFAECAVRGAGFCRRRQQTTDILKKAIAHKGYALVDIFQPCVTYNKVNTYQWYKNNTYYLDNSHDPYNRQAAFGKALETGKYPLGILYINDGRPTFEDTLAAYGHDTRPLYERTIDIDAIKRLMDSMRT